RSGEGQVLGNIGNIYYCLGEYRRAIKYHREAMKILKEVGATLERGESLNNLALDHYHLDENDRAKEYHEQAIKVLLQKAGGQLDRDKLLAGLGLAYCMLGEYQRAI